MRSSDYTLRAIALVAFLAAQSASGSELQDGWEALPAGTQQLLLENAAAAYVDSASAETSPAQQALDSLSKLEKLIKKGAHQNKLGFLEADPQAITYCRSTFTALCLNGRFIVSAGWDNPFDAAGAFTAGAIQLTPASGVLWFLDPTNFELVVKEINGCFTGPVSHWIFAAGLTNFQVAILVLDAATGVTRTYSNPPRQNFQPIIDQQTPFPCP